MNDLRIKDWSAGILALIEDDTSAIGEGEIVELRALVAEMRAEPEVPFARNIPNMLDNATHAALACFGMDAALVPDLADGINYALEVLVAPYFEETC